MGAGNNVIQIPPSSLTALAGIAAIAVPTAIIGATTAGQNPLKNNSIGFCDI